MSLNESKSSMTIYPSSFPHESSHKLENMKNDLDKFKQERLKSINEGTSDDKMNLKETFYSALEELIIDIIYISSFQKRNDKINLVYKWYKDKLTYFNSLAEIRYKTYNIQLELNDIPLDVSSSVSSPNSPRTLNNNTTDPRKVLEGYKLKKAFKTKNIFCNSLFDFSSTLGSTIAFTRYPPQLLQNKQVDKIDQTSHLNSAKNNVKEPSIYFSLKRQCDIITGKNKALSTKRHLEEVQTMINEYGFIRSRFKQDQIRRLDMKKIKSSYTNINTTERFKVFSNKIPEKRNCFIKLDGNQNKLFVNKKTIKKGLNNRANQRAKHINLSLIGKGSKQVISEMNFSELTKDNMISSDMIPTGISINPIFKERFANQALLDIQQNSLRKNTTLMHYNPISAYDLKHLESRSLEHKSEEVFPKLITSIECAKKQFNCSLSYLDLRKTMEKYKQYELTTLNKRLQTKRRQLNKSALAETFLLPKKNQFLMGYLPKTGQGLLPSNNPK